MPKTTQEIRAEYEAEVAADPNRKFNQRELDQRIAKEVFAARTEPETITQPPAPAPVDPTGRFSPEQMQAIESVRGEYNRPHVGVEKTIEGAGVEPLFDVVEQPGSGRPYAIHKTGAWERIFRGTPEEQQAAANPPPTPPGEVAPEGLVFPDTPQQAQQPIQPGGPKLPWLNLPEYKEYEDAWKNLGEKYKGVEGALGKAIDAEAGNVGKWEKAQLAASEAQKKVMTDRQAKFEELQANQVLREQARQDHVNAEMSKLENAVNQMKASKIDPYRFYRHPDGGVDYPKSIAAAIAVGLGQLGASLPAQYGGTGGPNVALQIIDKAIDRDLQAQRDDLANQRAGVGLQSNLLSQMRGMYSDERQAENAAKLMMLESFDMKLAEATAKTNDLKIIAEADKMRSELGLKKQTLIGDMQLRAAAKQVEGEGAMLGVKTQQAQAKYGAGLQRAQMQAKAQTQTQATQAFPGAALVDPNYVPNKDDIKVSKPLVGAWNEASSLLDELIAWRAQYGQEKLDRAALAIANTKLQRLKSAMRKVDDTGARLDAGEIEMMGLDFEMGDLGFVKEKLNAVKESVRGKVSAKIRPHGFRLLDQPVEGAKVR